MVRTDQWLGAPPPRADRDRARTELVRCYLRCYGPSTAEHLVQWAGIAPAQAAQMWNPVARDLVEMTVDGRQARLYVQDLVPFLWPSPPEGIRLLPPHDPYLVLRDRETLVPDRALQRRIWRPTGNPGVVLAAGRLVATWRHLKTAERLHATVELLESVSPGIRSEIEAEAVSLVPYQKCTSVAVEFTTSGGAHPIRVQ